MKKKYPKILISYKVI